MSIQKPTCYYPNGTAEPAYSPCRDIDIDSAEATFCCALDSSVCTSNGYCVGSAGVFYRGGCTDKGWGAQGCPQLCRSVTDGFANFYPCQPGDFSRGDWVCSGAGGSSSTNLCDSSGNTFSFDPGLPFDPRVKALSSVAKSTITATASVGAPTASAGPTQGSSQNTTHPEISCHSAKKSVGLEVGLPLGLTLLAVIAILSYLLFRERRQKNMTRKGLEEAKRENAGLHKGWTQWPVWKKSVYEADSTSASALAEMDGRMNHR